MSEPVYDDETLYAVRLTMPVRWGRAEFRPLHDHEMTGRVLNDIVKEYGSAAIDSASPVS